MVGKRQYHCNDSYFNSYDLQSCYWAGFIAADGYITKDNRRLELSLAIKDINHLQRFANDINYSGTIKCTSINRLNEKRLRLTSPQIINDLMSKFNIVNNKTWKHLLT